MPYTYIGGKHLKMTVVVKIAPKKQLLYKYKFSTDIIYAIFAGN